MTSLARPPLDYPYVAPRDAVEARLAQLWADVLRMGPLGADDDFFDLGGESLHAFALIARVHDAFGVTLTARDLFDGGTIARMAEIVRRKAVR